jgi:hypothetical protein
MVPSLRELVDVQGMQQPGSKACTVTRQPPAWILAAADQDYAAVSESVTLAVRGGQLLIHDMPEVQVWAEVLYAMQQIPTHAALAMGAAAIVQLAKEQS